MKFQGLFFLFALTSANIFEDALDFEKTIKEKLNITEEKEVTLDYENGTVITIAMPTTTTTTAATNMIPTLTTTMPTTPTTTAATKMIPTLTTTTIQTTTTTTAATKMIPTLTTTNITTLLTSTTTATTTPTSNSTPSKCNVLFIIKNFFCKFYFYIFRIEGLTYTIRPKKNKLCFSTFPSNFCHGIFLFFIFYFNCRYFFVA